MTKRKVRNEEKLDKNLLNLSAEIEKAIEFEGIYNEHTKLQDNVFTIEKVNTSDLSKIKSSVHTTLSLHPEVTELRVESCTLSNNIINNISKFLISNPNITSLRFDSCKINKYSIGTLSELFESANFLSHFQSFKGDIRLKSTSPYNDSILKNHFLTNVEFSAYSSGNVKDPVSVSKEPVARHLVSNQTLVHMLANSLYSKFSSAKQGVQKLDGGVLYFYQRSDKNLLKCYLVEILKAKALQKVMDGTKSLDESKVDAAKDLMNISKVKLSHGNYGYSPQTLVKKVLDSRNDGDQSFEKDASSILLKADNYIADNYFQLRAVFKGPNAVINFTRVVDVPKFILDHICSYLGANSLWQGNPKILPGRSIVTDTSTIYSIHECDKHYAYSISQWGLNDKFNLAVAKPVNTYVNHAPVVLTSTNNSSLDKNVDNDAVTIIPFVYQFDGDNQVMEGGEFDLYDAIYGQEEVDLMGWDYQD